MNAPHYYVESSKPNKCLFCGLGPDTPHLANIAPPSPCPDCLALAKWMRDTSSTGSPYHQGISAFIKEREP